MSMFLQLKAVLPLAVVRLAPPTFFELARFTAGKRVLINARYLKYAVCDLTLVKTHFPAVKRATSRKKKWAEHGKLHTFH